MRGLYMVAGVFALAGVSHASMRRWTYPDCEADNCYRAFVNEQYTKLAPSFCLEFLASTTTDTTVIPTPFENCAGDIHAVSSACSCITYTYTHSQTTNTSGVTPISTYPVITPTQSSCSSSTPSTTPSQVVTSTEVPSTTKAPPYSNTTASPSTSCTGSSSNLTTLVSSLNSTASSTTTICPTGSSSSNGSSWSLSTSYSTTVYTVTSCASSVTNCPATSSAYVTTTAVPVIVTVYPFHPSSQPVSTPGGAPNHSTTQATSKGNAGPTPTTPPSGGSGTIPTAAAARAWFNELALAAGGAVAVLFL